MKKIIILSALIFTILQSQFLTAQNNDHINCQTIESTAEQDLEMHTRISELKNNFARSSSNTCLPVVVHIIRDSNGNSQFDYTKLPLLVSQTNHYLIEMNTQIYIADVRFIDNDILYNHYFGSGSAAYDLINPYSELNATNLFIVNNGGNFAYGPTNNWETQTAIFISRNAVSKTRTTVGHEFGHYFGLRHTQSGTTYGNDSPAAEHVPRTGPNSNCSNAGDGICDTPADNYGSPDNEDIFGNPYAPDFSNIMSYYQDRSTLTDGQFSRMTEGLIYRLNDPDYDLLGYIPSQTIDVPTLTNISSTHLYNYLEWTNVNNNEGYIIERSTTSDTEGFKAIYNGAASKDSTHYEDREIESNTTYWYRIIPSNSCSAYSNVMEAIPSNPNIYCEPNNTCNPGWNLVPEHWLLKNTNNDTLVNLDTINCNSLVTVLNYDGIKLEQNKTYTIRSEQVNNGIHYYNTFIDFNIDGDFEDPGEWVIQNALSENYTFHEGSFTIPANITNGITAMRTMISRKQNYNGTIQYPITSPCDFPFFGFAQDFSIRLQKPRIIYVNDDAIGNDDGSDWDNAYVNFQDAIDDANVDDNVIAIYMKEGTYNPSTSQNNIYFYMYERPLNVYGGFPDHLNNPDLQDRDPNIYKTEIDGEILDPNNHNDNSSYLLRLSGNILSDLDTFEIDGLHFINARRQAVYVDNREDVDLSVNFTNCKFENNKTAYGAGLYLFNFFNSTGRIKANVEKCIFNNNGEGTGRGYGGAFYSYGDAVINISNSLFTNNSSKFGGAISIRKNSIPTEIWHSTFTLNGAQKGAGVCSITSRVNINNSIIYGNTSTYANYESVFRYSGRIYIKHSVLGDNPCPFYKVYCTNNQYYDPEFANPSNDFHIHPNSPAVDLGLNNSIVDDLDFQARPSGNGYDAGCYEVQSLPLRVQKSYPLENEISVYPNPVDQILRIRIKDNFEKGWLKIKNSNGKLIFQKELYIMEDEINLSHLSSGIYFIQIQSDELDHVQKFIKL